MRGREIPKYPNTRIPKSGPASAKVFGYLGIWVLGCFISPAFAAPTPEQIEFFEKKIRPVLVDHCYSCHSDKAEKIKGSLRLDTRDALLKGGTSGAAIVPGDPDASLLIKAVRYTDPDLQMPPKDKKLAPEQIADLEAWVKMGAPDPRVSAGPKPLTDITEARGRHWAFQPVTKPTLPSIKKSKWAQTPVDNFIAAKLDEKNLKPASPADRRTLIRRVTYDLIGLPPTPEEVDAFVRDKRPDAYALVVDRLLASPHYGERWGRYWLDVARYADSKGYLPGGEERRYKFSYTYRDYVIRAFNEDKPYDQFIVEQIAADKLPTASGDDKSSLAALGFLTLGRRFSGNQNDIIDDRIDVVTRGTMGMTVACARCHDHKFDPIPTRDYYSLHGIFSSTDEPGELPLLRPLQDSPEYQEYLKAKAKIEEEVEDFKDKEIAIFINGFRQNVGDFMLGARDAKKLTDQSKFDNWAGERKLNVTMLRRWMKDLDEREKKPDPIFSVWFKLAALPEVEFTTNAAALVKQAIAETQPNPVLAEALTERTTNSFQQVVDAYSKLFQKINGEWKAALKEAEKAKTNAPAALPDPNREALRQILYAEGTPINLPKDEARSLHARRLSEGSAPIRNKIDALSWTHPGVPLRAMSMVDRGNPHNSRVFIRGNPGNPGPEAPRQFLQVLTNAMSRSFTNGSGRLELARAIASPDNPLTARVYVNRVWMHHFGEPLVSTPGDFGVRTEAPLHRELLDYLAASFMENGWSPKKLHRLILLSATYQQSDEVSATANKVDPDNHYFSHVQAQRLDFEAMRDTLLAVSGKLDLKLGGVPVNIVSEPFSTRRAVYGLIDRQLLPGLFRTFDFANPDASSQGRFNTIVPQQALFLMNSPFVVEQARSLVKRPEIESAKDDEAKIQALYRTLWQRPAESAEVKLAEKYIAAQSKADTKLTPFEKYAQVLLLSNELMFVD